MKNIKRNLMLKMLSIRELPNGKPHIFSIKFVERSGKLRFLPQAISCGAGRMNIYENRMRSVQSCCSSGNPEGHVYQVKIDRFFYLYTMSVIL